MNYVYYIVLAILILVEIRIIIILCKIPKTIKTILTIFRSGGNHYTWSGLNEFPIMLSPSDCPNRFEDTSGSLKCFQN